MVINCRPRISKSNSESKGQTFLDFQACFKVDDGCDFMNCVICWCSCSIMILVSMWISQYWSCCSTWDKWIIYSWNYDIVVWSWWCTSDCDCDCVIGDRIATFWQANLDLISMFWYKYWIGLLHFHTNMESNCYVPEN